jgi:hypothetical protein
MAGIWPVDYLPIQLQNEDATPCRDESEMMGEVLTNDCAEQCLNHRDVRSTAGPALRWAIPRNQVTHASEESIGRDLRTPADLWDPSPSIDRLWIQRPSVAASPFISCFLFSTTLYAACKRCAEAACFCSYTPRSGRPPSGGEIKPGARAQQIRPRLARCLAWSS